MFFFHPPFVLLLLLPSLLSKGLWLSKRSGLMQGSANLNNVVFPLLSNLFIVVPSPLP
jgi:hypothetical protein